MYVQIFKTFLTESAFCECMFGVDEEETFTNGIEMFNQVGEDDQVVIFSLKDDIKGAIANGRVYKKQHGLVYLERDEQKFVIKSDGDCIRFVGDKSDEKYGELQVMVNSQLKSYS